MSRRGLGGGSRRATFSHNSSGSSGFAMTPSSGAIPGQRSRERYARFSHFATGSKHKLGILATLMGSRHNPLTTENVRALNMIDLVFHDQAKVRSLWHEYFDM